MSDPDWSTLWVRRAHADATRQLRAEGSLATPIPTLADCAVALRRLGVALPRAALLRLVLADGLPLADAPAETYATRARRG